MPFKIGQRYNIAGIGNVVIRQSKAKGKKKVAIRESDGKRVNFGAKGYTIQPNRDRGDNYCSRSKNLNTKGFNANTLARLDWNCRGSKSFPQLPKSVKPLPKKRRKK